MRRGNFLIVILFAFISYFALTAFLGHRPWMRYHYRHHNYYERCERGDSSCPDYRNERNRSTPENQFPDSSSPKK